MSNNLNRNPVYKTMPLSMRYALSAAGLLGRMMMRRDKPAPRMLRCTPR